MKPKSRPWTQPQFPSDISLSLQGFGFFLTAHLQLTKTPAVFYKDIIALKSFKISIAITKKKKKTITKRLFNNKLINRDLRIFSNGLMTVVSSLNLYTFHFIPDGTPDE